MNSNYHNLKCNANVSEMVSVPEHAADIMWEIYIYVNIYICEKYNQALSRISRQIIKLVTFLITNDLQILKYKGKFISIEYIYISYLLQWNCI